jgi:dTDP-4-dehydrorhamnose reductase
LAKSVNIEGPRNLAKACKEHKAILLQISTDFVFDGSQALFYTEESNELPLSVYGATKLKGEKAVAKVLKEHFIIRTAWLYSEYGNNFVKTMLKLGSERDELSVVCDQIGTPTYTKGLAKILIEIISIQSKSYGVYHYSNEGVASWYDFAVAIFELSKLNVNVIPIKSIYYKTAAERPKFSVMDKSKIKEMLGVQIPHWRESLNECLNLI